MNRVQPIAIVILALIIPKSHAHTFIAAEHPSQLSCG
jgi:hypothetical protein